MYTTNHFSNYTALNYCAKMDRKSDPDKAKIFYVGHWQIPVKAINVLCGDGVRRTVTLNRLDDGSHGFVRVYRDGKSFTVRGYIATNSDGDIFFHPYQYRKNGHVLPPFSFCLVEYKWVVDLPQPVVTGWSS